MCKEKIEYIKLSRKILDSRRILLYDNQGDYEWKICRTDFAV